MSETSSFDPPEAELSPEDVAPAGEPTEQEEPGFFGKWGKLIAAGGTALAVLGGAAAAYKLSQRNSDGGVTIVDEKTGKKTKLNVEQAHSWIDKLIAEEREESYANPMLPPVSEFADYTPARAAREARLLAAKARGKLRARETMDEAAAESKRYKLST